MGEENDFLVVFKNAVVIEFSASGSRDPRWKERAESASNETRRHPLCLLGLGLWQGVLGIVAVATAEPSIILGAEDAVDENHSDKLVMRARRYIGRFDLGRTFNSRARAKPAAAQQS